MIVAMGQSLRDNPSRPKYKLRVCIRSGDCLERNTSHRTAMNAYFREVLRTESTEKLYPGCQLKGEANKQFNMSL